ncbi:MAG: hypothetical protein PVH84_18845 [Candidatus Aminicenantes bacterium]|jgi:hypothetical protein
MATDLFLICGIAFLIVFIILAFLAFLMRLTMLVFPQKAVEMDSAMIAAIAATIHAAFPGTRITKLEEKK